MRTMKFAIARDSGLIEHLKMVIPQRDWQTEDVFLFPGCIHRCVTNTQHVLAFGPLDQNLSECTGSGLEYRIQSRFKHFHGMTRELFLNHQNGLVYAGRFKMHSLERLAPQGLYLPEDISPHHIAVAATPPLLPRGFPSFRQLGEMYKSGSLKVEAVALQMVDYDEGIYRTLLKPVQVKKGNQKLAPKALKEGTRVL
ncbi:hypothetical protein BDP27DRAFT_1316612 [Rhodocollybia butyracea]|uniref:Uncharacterized protein n=1 Tax=Rhodocollybia butyracea TaxID=206335 RepID=A0A9P5UDW3_9AGAR|nr:hypothetical protein BDP27DRAFT_1316612 [Rhodocollybia butyracea]